MLVGLEKKDCASKPIALEKMGKLVDDFVRKASCKADGSKKRNFMETPKPEPCQNPISFNFFSYDVHS